MVATPREIVLDVKMPDLKKYIREALEEAWEEGFKAATNVWLRAADIEDNENPFRRN